MSERRRRRGRGGGARSGGGRRRQAKSFMDAAMDAYARHLALQKWREVTDRQDSLGLDAAQAVREAGQFLGLGAYQDIWERWWAAEVVAVDGTSDEPLFGCIETAVRGALMEEIQTRQERGDPPVEDGMAYKTFVDYALDRLFEEEAGSLEEL